MIDKFTIVRDSREKPGHGWEYGETAHCNGTVVDTLRTGDYTVRGLENFVCIERKETIDEFAHNCIEKRWQDCMRRMSDCIFPFLLFEFSWEDVNTYPASAKVPLRIKQKLRIPAKYIQKVIATARNQYGIHVLACGDRIKAEKIAYRIMRKAYEIQLRRGEL